jgi:hypothetical protein
MPGMPKYDPRCLAYSWNWFNTSAVEFYLRHYVEPLVALPGFDAVFFDGADEFLRQGTWRHATNVPAGASEDDA